MAAPPGIPTPQMPQGPMGTSPAMPGKVPQDGKIARGKVVAGLGLEMLRVSIPLLGNSEEGLLVTEVTAKLAKRFMKPPEDLGKSELGFMQSQLFGQGGPAGGAPGGAAPGGAPPQQVPSPAPMPAAA